MASTTACSFRRSGTMPRSRLGSFRLKPEATGEHDSPKRKAGFKDPALRHSIHRLRESARYRTARPRTRGYSISSLVKASSGSTKYSISRSSSSSSGVGGGGGGG